MREFPVYRGCDVCSVYTSTALEVEAAQESLRATLDLRATHEDWCEPHATWTADYPTWCDERVKRAAASRERAVKAFENHTCEHKEERR